MKKLILSAFVLFAALTSFAQIEKGAMFLGGQLSYSGGTDKTEIGGNSSESTTANFRFYPSFGYFFTDEIAAGLKIGMDINAIVTPAGTNANGDEVDDEDLYAATVFELFGRYYKGINEKAYFFGELSLGFGSGTRTLIKQDLQNSSESETKYSVDLFRFGITPGFNYFIADRWGLEMTFGFLGYESMTEENSDAEYKRTNSKVGVNVDLNTFTLGARYYF